jgi:hypothetical protein
VESVPELRKHALFVFTEDADNPQPANPWQDFTPAPRSNSRDINGKLTAFGKLYAAWDNDATFRADKTYYVHNKSTRKRLANLLASNPDARSIRVDENSASWTLVSTGTTNRYYLVSSRDGRRLSSNGTAVTLAAAGTSGTSVEWSLTENQHGWFYLGHPSSSKRLRLAYNNTTSAATYTMVATTITDDESKWRFIVPPSEAVNTAPVLAAITPQTVNEGVLLTFTASAADADLPANPLTYSLIGAPTGAVINSSSGVFTWTPTEAQGPSTFTFTTRVSDGNLSHDRSVSVTVASPPPSPEVDTDGDGLSDLLEYAFLTDSKVPNANPFRVIGANAGTVTLEFPWNWQAAGLSWRIRHGHDLANMTAWPVVAPGVTTTVRQGAVDRITVAPAMAYSDRGFYVMEIIRN